MTAVFEEFGLERVTFSEGALRLGVLYDLLGRYHHHDLRDATVANYMRRYGVERPQAERVAQTALALLKQFGGGVTDDVEARYLAWSAQLHEIGISVAHSGYHKHSAYILANADMPGFSRKDQGRLSRIVLAHRGKLERVQPMAPNSPDWPLVLCLRLAVLLHRARDDVDMPPLDLRPTARGYQLTADADWLAASPLTAKALEEEVRHWASVGKEFHLRASRLLGRTAAR
jgi:exopolyphosphatase/guanosine-5'-triphosphate,3'-diphosphate pyrophosphatase